jgi:hypothetical protein
MERFAKPTVAQIAAYAAEIGYTTLDAERFFDHYESCGWVVGARKPMRNWQATVRNWRRMDAERGAGAYGAGRALPAKPAAEIGDYAHQALRIIRDQNGFEIGRFWRKVKDAVGPDGLAQVKALVEDAQRHTS